MTSPALSSLSTTFPPSYQKQEQKGFDLYSMTIEPSVVALSRYVNGLQDRIKAFANLGENWNGYDVAAPNPAAIAKANQWIERFVRDHNICLEPMVSPDENGDIVFEWQRGKRWLCVTVSANAVTTLREGNLAPGESEEGQADTPQQREALWTWLMS